jgi:hypothetical protein
VKAPACACIERSAWARTISSSEPAVIEEHGSLSPRYRPAVNATPLHPMIRLRYMRRGGELAVETRSLAVGFDGRFYVDARDDSPSLVTPLLDHYGSGLAPLPIIEPGPGATEVFCIAEGRLIARSAAGFAFCFVTASQNGGFERADLVSLDDTRHIVYENVACAFQQEGAPEREPLEFRLSQPGQLFGDRARPSGLSTGALRTVTSLAADSPRSRT